MTAEGVRTDPGPAGTEGTTRSTPSGFNRHTTVLGVLMVAAAALYAVVSFNRFYTFRAGTYDLVIFDQAVRSYSHFRLPVAIVKGVHNGFGPGFAVLGDHFSPVLALLAPLYWIHDGPQTLLVAQAVLLASAVAPLWVLTRRELGTVAAYCVAVGYALAWPVAQAAAFDFHEVAFAPLIMAVVFERLSAYRHGSGRWWHVAVACVALLAVKEDMGLAVAGLGVAIVAGSIRPRRREALLLGTACVVGGLLSAYVATRVLVPAFGGRADYYWFYGKLGSSVPGAAWHIVTHPLDSLHTFTHPVVKVRTMAWLVAMAAVLPVASPYALVALPLVAERMFADAPNWWVLDYHYNAFVVIPLLCAGVDGAARIRRLLRGAGGRTAVPAWIGDRFGDLWAGAVLAVAIFALPSFAFGTVVDASSWRLDADMRAAALAAAQVPDGALVEAASPIGPRLTARTRVLLWDRSPRWAPWVVADVQRDRFPFCNVDQQRQRVDLLEGGGYRVVFQQRGYVVLHNPAAVPQLLAPPAPKCP